MTLLQGQGRGIDTGTRKGHCYRDKEDMLQRQLGMDIVNVSNVTRTRKGHYYRSNMEGKLLQQFGRDIVTRATCKGHMGNMEGTVLNKVAPKSTECYWDVNLILCRQS